jgi:hypothetical protein
MIHMPLQFPSSLLQIRTGCFADLSGHALVLVMIDRVAFATEASLFRLCIPLIIYPSFAIRMPGRRNTNTHTRSVSP